MAPSNDWRDRAAKLSALFARATPVGVLRLPTGRIIPGEPVTTLDRVPLTRTAPIGEFPVELGLVEVEPGESRIAAARIVFSAEPIASWEVATGASNAATPGPGGLPGYRGPAGMFMDAHTAPLFQRFVDDHDSVEWWSDLPRQQGRIWEHACFQPDDQTPYNCAYMAPLLADGAFVSYWGLDASGAPVVLVTDFNVVPI
jgi:hypothetical protein